MSELVGPTWRTLRSFGLAVWVLVAGGWETFVWGNIRAGSVTLAGTPRSFRFLIRVALWLTVGLLATLLLGDTWRALSPLVPLVFYNDSLSGLYAPQVFVPITLGLLALAWAYLLSGALHAPGWGKLLVIVLLVFFDSGLSLTLLTDLVTGLGPIFAGSSSVLWNLLAVAIHTLAWLALLGLFVLRWRRPAAPGFEFPAVLALMTLLFFSSYYGTLLASQAFQLATVATSLQLTNTLDTITILLLPFLLISGAEVAGFGMALTRQVTGRLAGLPQAEGKWARRLWVGALLLFLLWRLASLWLAPLISHDQVLPGGGAVIAVAAGGLLYLLLRRRPALGSLPEWVIPSAAILFYVLLVVVQLLGILEAVLAAAAIASGLSTDRVFAVIDRGFAFLARENEVFVAAVAVLFGLAAWLRARLRRQPLPAVSLYAWMFAGWVLFWEFTRRGQVLGRLAFNYRDIEALAMPLLLAGLLLAALVRRLSRRTLLHLTAAAVLLWLLESQAWLSDPLSPLFGLIGAQAVFLSVSIFLNVMSAGDHFALNEEFEHFPRLSRALLYFGYALLTVTTVTWLAASHNAPAMAQQGQVATNGFIAIGLPLAFFTLLTANPDLLGDEAPRVEKKE